MDILVNSDRPLLAGCGLLLPAAMGRSLPPRLCRPLVKSDASEWSASMQLPGQMSAISQTGGQVVKSYCSHFAAQTPSG